MLFLIPILSLPLFYFELLGVRVLLFCTLLPVLILAFKSIRGVVVDEFFIISFLLFVLIALLSMLSISFDVLFAAIIFFGLLFSSSFLPSSFSNSEEEQLFLIRAQLCYISSAIVMSIGLIFQLVFYKYFGYQFGMIAEFAGRTAFAFTWSDFSFLSLFIASAVPFAKDLRLKTRVLVVFILLVGCVATSARTGLYSLLIFYIGLFSFRVGKDVIRLKLKKIYILGFLLLSFLAPFGYHLVSGFSSRILNLDGSGRLEGYVSSVYSIEGSPFLGYMFDVESYLSLVGVLPHNLFLYMLSMAGVIGLFLFMIWLSLLLYRSYLVGNNFSYAIFICCIGAQLIPSVYSMYYLAILISCLNFSYRRLSHKTSADQVL